MAFVLPLGKLTILVGAGILGSVLAKERQMPSVSDVFSTAFKIVKPSGFFSISTKTKDDALLAQVNSLKQELQLLVSNRPVTIVTSGEGGFNYSVFHMKLSKLSYKYPFLSHVKQLLVMAMYGWKGWKLPDITFATKRSLSDACTAIARRLEQVYSSISATRRDLSSRIESADSSLNNLSEENVSTRNEVSLLRGEMRTYDVNIQSVREVVESLECRILNMQENGDAINFRVIRLVDVVNTERRRTQEALLGATSAASTPALEHSPRTLSLPPPAQSSELPFPISSGSNELNGAEASASGLRDIPEITQAVNTVLSGPVISNGNRNRNLLSDSANGSATGGFFSRINPNSISFMSRTRSVTK